MRVAVCGGGLQGVEACFLAGAAGWETLLLDKRPDPPALGLADAFARVDLASEREAETAARLMKDADLVLPALENDEALASLARLCSAAGVPFAHDPAAYAVSRSKLRSRDLFQAAGIPIPHPCSAPAYPMMAKPSRGSGSHGVRLFRSDAELLSVFPEGVATPEWIFEAYCPGPSYSIEVCGRPGRHRAFPITELFMDQAYDCKRVAAPAERDRDEADSFVALALRLADRLSLRGIMDVEAVLTPSGLKVLEIDARFPSQTPMAIFAATWINLVVEWARCFLDLPEEPSGAPAAPRHALLEHLHRDGERLTTQGERIMAAHGPLGLMADCHGADTCIASGARPPETGTESGGAGESKRTASRSGGFPEAPWAATMIFTGENAEEAAAKRRACLSAVMRACNLRGHDDPEPDGARQPWAPAL